MPHALIIGGSVGGLLAANLLRGIGWQVTVLERVERDLGDRGAAIGITGALLEVMQRIDPRIDRSIGVETRSRIMLDRQGEIAAEAPIRGLTGAWSRLYRPLRDALPSASYRAGALLQRIELGSSGVTAVLEDGGRVTGNLLIAADGIHSTVRRQLLPDVTPHYAGYVVWRAVLRERGIPPAVHDRIFHHMSFCFPDGEMVLCLPMAAAEGESERRFQIAWFRPADEAALQDMCTDATGRQHGTSIPPPLIRADVLAALRASAGTLLPAEIAALLAQATQPILQPIFDSASPRIAFDRVVLLGDAAFVARPHVATGVTKAALDAKCLIGALSTGNSIDAALAQYERERQLAGCRLVARSRYLGQHLEARADRARVERDPEQTLREYGAEGAVDERTIDAHLAGLAP
jgi:2-polyprenyl-6-methoxyphenol hydroxylase-like FAD-dependent oxidoreductase